MRGRPLAFLFLVVAGWGTGRVLWLSPDDVARPLAFASGGALIAPAQAKTPPDPRALPIPPGIEVIIRSDLRSSVSRRIPLGRSDYANPATAIVVAVTTRASAPGSLPASSSELFNPAPPGLPPTAIVTGRHSRWSGSAWTIIRDGGGGSLLSPLLGGSQAGVRLAYRLDDHGNVALFTRAATPLRNDSVELAAGAQWRPTRAPVTVYAEVRATRGEAAPVVGLFGGDTVALTKDFRLEGYGQAGVIRRDGVSRFGDAQIRLIRPFGRVEAGAGVWAAAQRGATRVDVGPTIALPIQAEPLALRLTLDWRQRVAGNARPASGPALSLGADF